MKIKTMIAVSLSSTAMSHAALYNLTGTIDGAQANAGAGTGSLATGTISGDYDDVTNTLNWSISWNSAALINGAGSETVHHFHAAPAGSNGPVAISIGVASNPAVGNATLTEAQETAMLAEGWYVNLHTSAFNGGEIRGQVIPTVIPEPSSLALISLCALPFFRRSRRRA